jgi:hypothetical protein
MLSVKLSTRFSAVRSISSTDPNASDRSRSDKRASGLDLERSGSEFRLTLSVSRSPFLPRLVWLGFDLAQEVAQLGRGERDTREGVELVG